MSAPGPLHARLAQARLALMVLTRLPVGTLSDPVPALSRTLWAWPLVGAVVAALQVLVLLGATGLGLAPGIVAVLVLAAGALATGALHEDGLADLADGLGGGATPARKLEIMRDSRIGSYGVLALIGVCVLRWAALGELIAAGRGPGPVAIALVVVAVVSRAAMGGLAVVLPPARDGGLGHAVAGAGQARFWICALVGGLGALLAVPVAGPVGVLWLVVGMGLSGAALGRIAQRQIGGQTGDVLGAAQILCETAGLVILSAFVTIP